MPLVSPEPAPVQFDPVEALNVLDDVHEHLAACYQREVQALYAHGDAESRRLCRERFDSMMTQVAKTMDFLRTVRR